MFFFLSGYDASFALSGQDHTARWFDRAPVGDDGQLAVIVRVSVSVYVSAGRPPPGMV